MLNARRMLGEPAPVVSVAPARPPSRPPVPPGNPRPNSGRSAALNRFKASPSPTEMDSVNMDSVKSGNSTKSPQSPLSEVDSWSEGESEKYESSEPEEEGENAPSKEREEESEGRARGEDGEGERGGSKRMNFGDTQRRGDMRSPMGDTQVKRLEVTVKLLEEELSREQERRADVEEQLGSESAKAMQTPRPPNSARGPASDYQQMDAGCQTSGEIVLEEDLGARMGALQDQNDTLAIENEALCRRLEALEAEAAQLREDNSVLWQEQEQLRALKEDRRDLQKKLEAASQAARAPRAAVPTFHGGFAAPSPARAGGAGEETPRASAGRGGGSQGGATPRSSAASPAGSAGGEGDGAPLSYRAGSAGRAGGAGG
ncbi:hypothetical protein T484DRAFT_1909101, partial [Baffinella frigidus]